MKGMNIKKMFTGIVEEMGKVKSIIHGGSSIRLTIECKNLLQDTRQGDSIAVNGICLTVTALGDQCFSADVMPETMRKTNLGTLKLLEKVNLERALKLMDRLGGHIVSGHIDGTGTIIEKKSEDNAIWLTVEAARNILKYIVPKGSVSLDGTSLTIVHVDENSFSVSLIPLTQGVTTLGDRKTGEIVNIECDVIGKYIEKLIMGRSDEPVKENGLSLEFLKENGFI